MIKRMKKKPKKIGILETAEKLVGGTLKKIMQKKISNAQDF